MTRRRCMITNTEQCFMMNMRRLDANCDAANGRFVEIIIARDLLDAMAAVSAAAYLAGTLQVGENTRDH